MMTQHRILLVVGKNHKEIAAKYSKTSSGEREEIILLTKDKAEQTLKNNIEFQKAQLKFNGQMVKVDEETGTLVAVPDEKDWTRVVSYDEETGVEKREYQAFRVKIDEEATKRNLERLESYTPETYFQACVKNSLKRGCELVDDKIVAYKYNNPHGVYSYEECCQDMMETFTSPLPLINGEEVYTARKGDVNWGLINMCEADVEDATIIWETCKEGREPSNEQEEKLYNAMKNRVAYLDNFEAKQEFVNHNCAFWCYGIATTDECILKNQVEDEKAYVTDFFKRFIEPLSDDEVITLYEIVV